MPELDITIDDPFENGDFKIENSDYQNIQAIMIAQKGQFYQWPTLGVDIKSFLNSPSNVAFLRTTVTDELLKDNYELTEYQAIYKDDKFTINIDAQKLI